MAEINIWSRTIQVSQTVPLLVLASRHVWAVHPILSGFLAELYVVFCLFGLSCDCW